MEKEKGYKINIRELLTLSKYIVDLSENEDDLDDDIIITRELIEKAKDYIKYMEEV